MSDTGDLVVALGELERAIGRLGDDDRVRARAAAATLIPPFGDPGAAGWYDRFLESAGGGPEATTLSAAVKQLGLPPASPGVLPRRVIAIGAAARALPDRFGPGGDESELVQLALSGPGILRSAPSVFDDHDRGDPEILDEAPGFHALLVDPAALPHVGAYREFLAHPDVRGLVHQELVAAPAPCSTEVVEVAGPGGGGVAVALVTRVCVTGVTLADLAAKTSFLNPGNWSSYEHWCHMEPDPANTADPDAAGRFLEVVALDCPTSWFEVAVWLDFTRLVSTSDRLIRSYAMSADQSTVAGGARANGAVDVDEGTIKAVAAHDHVQVTTTKRVHFTVPVDQTALAVLSCGAGYGALAADFVVDGTGGRAKDAVCPPRTIRPGGGAGAEKADDELLAERFEALGRTADECLAAAKVGLDKAGAGTYTADDLASDVAASIVRSIRAGRQLVDVAAAVVQPPRRRGEVVSDTFTLPVPAAGQSRLVLGGPMMSARGDLLPVAQVGFDPEPLPAGGDTFSLVVRSAGLAGTTYFGVVEASDPATGRRDVVHVDVQVP